AMRSAAARIAGTHSRPTAVFTSAEARRWLSARSERGSARVMTHDWSARGEHLRYHRIGFGRTDVHERSIRSKRVDPRRDEMGKYLPFQRDRSIRGNSADDLLRQQIDARFDPTRLVRAGFLLEP